MLRLLCVGVVLHTVGRVANVCDMQEKEHIARGSEMSGFPGKKIRELCKNQGPQYRPLMYYDPYSQDAQKMAP